MIPFDFEYHLPGSIEEARQVFTALAAADKEPLYYAGGTEIISLARRGRLKFGALVDLKGIPEMKIVETAGENIVFGACTTLSDLAGQDDFPLLAAVARGVADHTVRNRLTLGGNICGRLPYRETLLPFLLSGGEAILSGPAGLRREPLDRVFDKRLRLERGEFLVQLTVTGEAAGRAWWTGRRERQGRVDYPLLHLAAASDGSRLALAVSGLCAYPFRHGPLEEMLGDWDRPAAERVKESLNLLPAAVRSDDLASVGYRRALWRRALEQMLAEIGGGS